MKITIAHLYPDLLNLYGDNGNIAALRYRLKKRGIQVEVKEYCIGDIIDFENTDIIFIGGGSDSELRMVCSELCKFKEEIKSYAENGGCILAVCGGFQLLGNYYMLKDEKIPALGVLDIHSEYSPERLIGDAVIKCEFLNTEIVGFENHAGLMFIGNYPPLGTVITGKGNDGKCCKEGIIYKNTIATFLHGPLLPKNPVLTDYILSRAIENRYGKKELVPLDDTLEKLAHDYIVNRFTQNN